MVMPLETCWARPQEGNIVYPLKDHLLTVAHAIGSPSGEPIERLHFLCGLLHDAGKAQLAWQEYIRNPGRKRGSSVSHAPIGAALFAVYGYYFLQSLELAGNREMQLLFLRLTRDVADHHSKLNDIEDYPPWSGKWDPRQLETMDLVGLANLVQKYLPETCPPWGHDPDKIQTELSRLHRPWQRYVLKLGYFRRPGDPRRLAAYCDRSDTAALIVADRFHAGGIEENKITSETARKSLNHFYSYCQERAASIKQMGGTSITDTRQQVQDQAVEKFCQDPSQLIYTLELPTGFGKTLTGLRVALTACQQNDLQRIIYVAPYLSILSQAANEIRQATGLEPLQHHHLAVSEKQEFDDRDYLAMESWQGPVVVTTFNQFFRALFPARAQQTMRLKALEGAFVIVDEPQIIDSGTWNLFLAMLEALAQNKHMQVLLMTATLPPTEAGLITTPVSLAPKNLETVNRFNISVEKGSWDAKKLAETAVTTCEEKGSVGVVVNTIADATQIYLAAKNLAGDNIDIFNLHACMQPQHKRYQIKSIKDHMTNKSGKPVLVISTQIIEAGVDLSFRHVFRARPIVPSVVQTAGRVNRHGEGESGIVSVVDFLREGKTDTRHYVYRDAITREETDALLTIGSIWKEERAGELVRAYYKGVFARNPNTAALEYISDAAAGQWSSLAGIEPFGADIPTVSVFVPAGEEWLTNNAKELMAHFSCRNIAELYELYVKPGWLAKRSFVERKRFLSLMQEFIVPVNFKVAQQVADLSGEKAIVPAVNPEDYSAATGFGHLVGANPESIFL
ncbi:MAG: CRISPR-associated helicase Cas3' [Firmicutes bacterium]|jgi:CRISPR-associated endonuclease/helicase Cas3|nr:CRISPR-associated helicase Cas3' [Bacillota bacterium]